MQKYCSHFTNDIRQRKSQENWLGRGLRKKSTFPPALRKIHIYLVFVEVGSVMERNAC